MGQPLCKGRQPKPGDHIYCAGKGRLYDHHGIYVGDGMVIHLAGAAKKIGPSPPCQKCGNKRVINGEIARTCLDCFLDGKPVEFYDYGVSFLEFGTRRHGTCSVHNSKPDHEVIQRATDFLEGNRNFGSYDLLFNNCESFAVYCKTGRAVSQQVVGLCERTGVITAAAIINPALGIGVAGAYGLAKLINDDQRRR